MLEKKAVKPKIKEPISPLIKLMAKLSKVIFKK
jgi:hypothetical protein